MRPTELALALAGLLVVGACSGGTERAHVDEPIELMVLPESHLVKCQRFPQLEPACPRNLPVVESEQNRSRSFRSGKEHFVFFSEWSGPYPGVTTNNSPPRFLHVNVHAGDLRQAFPFEWPMEATALPDPIPKKRRKSILLENVTWFGKEGSLILAPSFPAGGIDGDHVIFRWHEAGDEYAISIHAWAPLTETVNALRAVIGSTDLAGER
jgi:hypothetical protein